MTAYPGNAVFLMLQDIMSKIKTPDMNSQYQSYLQKNKNTVRSKMTSLVSSFFFLKKKTKLIYLKTNCV